MEAQISRRLQHADLVLPPDSSRAGDLLSLSRTDPVWGAELPLVVVHCSLTDGVCTRNVQELDEQARRSQAHLQVR